jgi:predicted dienelactone hydrolase
MRNSVTRPVLVLALVVTTAPHRARADEVHPVGVKQVEYVTADDHRDMSMVLFYPAVETPGSEVLPVPYGADLHLVKDAPFAEGDGRRPLIMFSHGRGSDAWQYAWFSQILASHGYIVAAINHYRANTYDRELAYMTNRIWQRPVDVSLDITHLLHDPFWGARIDPDQIGVSGHSQGGFTALWVGGARVNAAEFLDFQKSFATSERLPEAIRRTLPVDAEPALHVQDKRVKAVFALAPGLLQVFGMDADGLRQTAVPTFMTVGAGDTQTPPADNAEFAARFIPNAQLWVIPGPVGHEIFSNECDQEGRDNFPEACVDAPGVDRHALHEQIGKAALKFFGDTLKPRSGQPSPAGPSKPRLVSESK